MIFSLLQIVSPDEVAEIHYFLQPLQDKPVVWCIRGIAILIIVLFFVLYRKMKRRDGE